MNKIDLKLACRLDEEFAAELAPLATVEALKIIKTDNPNSKVSLRISPCNSYFEIIAEEIYWDSKLEEKLKEHSSGYSIFQSSIELISKKVENKISLK